MPLNKETKLIKCRKGQIEHMIFEDPGRYGMWELLVSSKDSLKL